MKKFDVIATNPPFQNREKRKRTPHKIWIEFTVAAFEKWLKPEELLLQISPASFSSPSNKVLPLMRSHKTELLDFNASKWFPKVGSTFAWYAIRNKKPDGNTVVNSEGNIFSIKLDEKVLWLPTDLSEEGFAVHRKVMWETANKLGVSHDYVSCHNKTLGDTLSKTKTSYHKNPVFHTNVQTWYTSLRLDWAGTKKVMWTRSGYTKPFYDNGTLGGTDMVYYVPVRTDAEGQHLAHNLNLPLFRYIFSTARWSGFGNEKVFDNLPRVPSDHSYTHEEICNYYKLTLQEANHVKSW